MPKDVYYDDVKIIKKPLKSRAKIIMITILIFFVLAGIVASSFYISKSITVGNIGSLFVYGDSTVKVTEKKMYMVALGVYQSKEEAERVSLGATVQGASGFIWGKDNNFYVVGSMYENLQDAESVKTNLVATSTYSVTIEEVIFPKLELKFEEYDNKDVSMVKDALQFIDQVYNELNDYSIKYDKSEMNNLAISSNISTLRGRGKGYINKIQALLAMPNAKLQVIQDYLIELDELLDTAIIRTIDNTGINYYLKNAFVNVARLKYDCLNKLK